MTDDRVETMLDLLTSPEATPEARIQAMTRLGDMLTGTDEVNLNGPRIILALIDQVQKGQNPVEVSHALSVLGRVKAYGAISVMIDAALGIHLVLFEAEDGFRDTEAGMQVRAAAIQALGRMRDERAVIPLMSILNDRDENYRLRLVAAENLGRAGDLHAVQPLASILADDREKSLYLKESVAKALGMLGDIRAVDSMLDVLETKQGIRDKFDFLKERIIESLGKILSRQDRHSKAIRSLLAALNDEASSIRLAAVEALAEIGNFQCLEPLREKVFDTDDDVAVAAVSAIYHIGGEAAIRDVLKLENLSGFIRDELESYIP